jgi:soluble P-type ATPase
MITMERPGQEPLRIEYILIDFEGTLAVDRRVDPKAKDKMNLLSRRTKIYVLAQGQDQVAEEVLKKVTAEVVHLKEGESSLGKLSLLNELGPQRTVAIGNGLDDVAMVENAGLGICVISREGTASEMLEKADLVVANILDALDFLLKPMRQQATLSR